MNPSTPDCIRLTGMVLDCIIGIYPSERLRRQPLSADVALYLSTKECGYDVNLSASVDYAKIVGEIRFLIETCRFHFLETAAEALCAYLTAPPQRNPQRAQIDEVSIKLSKPQALMNGVQPSVEIKRKLASYEYDLRHSEFGSHMTVFKSRDCSIHRLEMNPGASFSPGALFPASSELILSSGLTQNDCPLKTGSAYTWAHAADRSYKNPTADFQTLICVERAILVPEEQMALQTQSRAFFSNSVTPHYYPSEA